MEIISVHREVRTKVINIYDCETKNIKVLPWLRCLVPDLSLRRTGLDPRSFQVGFVADKVALEQVFSVYFGFPMSVSFHQYTILFFVYMLFALTRRTNGRSQGTS
jgi:hypothetical protein